MNAEEIREKLDWLSKTDPKFWPSLATEHRFRLSPPLSETEIQSACEAYGIELPQDYVDFLLHGGNGGAGPGYGLERFGYASSKSRKPGAKPKRPRKAPSRPFPLDGPVDDEDDEIWESGRLDDGVWPLASYGCGIMANLVLNGPFRGQVWVVDPNESSYEPFAERAYLHYEECDVIRDKDDDIVFTFWEWYEHWLDYTFLQVQADYQAAEQP
jgi:hypothetical protein